MKIQIKVHILTKGSFVGGINYRSLYFKIDFFDVDNDIIPKTEAET